MSARVLETLLPLLRHEPARRRVRATLDGELVVDSAAAVMVWEPGRLLPAYAVPEGDVRGALEPAPAIAPSGPLGFRLPDGQPVLDPSVPFAVHTAEGEPLTLRAANGAARPGAAFRPVDPDLDGLVLLDFAALDAWYEEEEPIAGHPRDVLHHIEVLAGSRPVRVELDGTLLAESTRAWLLFEHPVLPVRAYLPPEDVCAPLQRSGTRTRCPYKGEATYWSLELDGRRHDDLAWTYRAPHAGVAEIAGLVSFFDERVDVRIGDDRAPRPRTGWSPPALRGA